MIKRCEFCGRLFHTTRQDAKYCSRDCWRIARSHRLEDEAFEKPRGDPNPQQILTLAAVVRSTWSAQAFRLRYNAPADEMPRVYSAGLLRRECS